MPLKSVEEEMREEGLEKRERNNITICENTQLKLYLPDKPVGELLHKSIDLIPVSKHAAWPAKKQAVPER